MEFVRLMRTVFSEPSDQGIARGPAIWGRDEQPVVLDRDIVIRVPGFVQEKGARTDQAVSPHELRADQGKRHRFARERTSQQIRSLGLGQSGQKRPDPMPRGEKGRRGSRFETTPLGLKSSERGQGLAAK